MAYFPSRLMPKTTKANAPGAEPSSLTVVAADYNRHDEEIRAIQEFMGTTGGSLFAGRSNEDLPALRVLSSEDSQTQSSQVVSRSSQSSDLTERVNDLIDKVNNFTEFAGNSNSSGFIHSGQKIVMPEQVGTTFLRTIPSASDGTISVESTVGFPQSGTLTILNDVQRSVSSSSSSVTFAEWIRYTNKTSTEFLGCTRGYLGTTKGPHSGSIVQPRETTTFGKNRRDLCVLLDGVEVSVCQREWPAWRQRRRFRIPFFGVGGFRRDLVNYLRKFGPRVPLTSQDQTLAATVVGVARDQGILTTRNGVPFLRSNSLSNVRRLQLGWAEAETYLDGLEAAGAVEDETVPNDFEVGKIPVFAGRVGVNYSLAAITRVGTRNMDEIQIVQSADGRVFTFMVDLENKDRTLQAISSYDVYCVSSLVSTRDRSEL